MKKHFFRFLLAVAVCAFGFSTLARAQDLGAVKARMDARLSKLDALKAKGVVGENNHGLVEVRGADPEAAAVVAAENSDRQAVYADIAKRTGSTADQVGRARAKQLAGSSAAGVWIQKEDGSWVRK